MGNFGDGAADGFEENFGIDFGADAVEVRGVGDADDVAGDSAAAQDRGFDTGGADVEAEEGHAHRGTGASPVFSFQYKDHGRGARATSEEITSASGSSVSRR